MKIEELPTLTEYTSRIIIEGFDHYNDDEEEVTLD